MERGDQVMDSKGYKRMKYKSRKQANLRRSVMVWGIVRIEQSKGWFSQERALVPQGTRRGQSVWINKGAISTPKGYAPAKIKAVFCGYINSKKSDFDEIERDIIKDMNSPKELAKQPHWYMRAKENV